MTDCIDCRYCRVYKEHPCNSIHGVKILDCSKFLSTKEYYEIIKNSRKKKLLERE